MMWAASMTSGIVLPLVCNIKKLTKPDTLTIILNKCDNLKQIIYSKEVIEVKRWLQIIAWKHCILKYVIDFILIYVFIFYLYKYDSNL